MISDCDFVCFWLCKHLIVKTIMFTILPCWSRLPESHFPAPHWAGHGGPRESSRTWWSWGLWIIILWWTYKKLWKMAIEIVSLPIENGGSFHGKMLVHQRVNHQKMVEHETTLFHTCSAVYSDCSHCLICLCFYWCFEQMGLNQKT